MAGFGDILQNPQNRAMLQQMGGRPGGPGGIVRRRPSNPLSNLADAYPKMKEQSDRMKIDEAERKAKKLKFEMMFKKAEQAFQLKQQQQAMQQGQAQINAARNSV